MHGQDWQLKELLLALNVPEALQKFVCCACPHIPHKVQGILGKLLHLQNHSRMSGKVKLGDGPHLEA